MAAPATRAAAAETMGVSARRAPRINMGMATGEAGAVRERTWLMG